MHCMSLYVTSSRHCSTEDYHFKVTPKVHLLVILSPFSMFSRNMYNIFNYPKKICSILNDPACQWKLNKCQNKVRNLIYKSCFKTTLDITFQNTIIGPHDIYLTKFRVVIITTLKLTCQLHNLFVRFSVSPSSSVIHRHAFPM
jgi:hypothetical protein